MNRPTKQTDMSALHIAVQLKATEIIELLLQCPMLDVNILSPQHGTPLHMACKVDSLPIVQQLLLNNAEQSIGIKNSKNKTPKEVTKN